MNISIDQVFKCPRCGCNAIEEIQIDATVTTRLLSIVDDEPVYDEPSIGGDSEVDRFQCVGCGHKIAKDFEQLKEVLKI